MASTAVLSQIPPQSPDHTPSPTTKRYAFTPRPNSKVPRAWERKPSTPFAPRNESQKIWKRYEFPDSNHNDRPAGGIRQTNTTESRALKKLRLEGTEATAHITTWDEELHEARHKETTQQDSKSTHPSSTAPPTIAVAQNDDRGAYARKPETFLKATEIIEVESATDDSPAEEEKRSFIPDPCPIHEDLDNGEPEGTSPKEKAMTAQPGLERNQDSYEQNVDTRHRTPQDYLPPHTEVCEKDGQGTKGKTDKPGREKALSVASLTKADTVGEGRVGAEEMIDGAAEPMVETAPKEAAEDDSNADSPAQVTEVDLHSSPSQCETITEAIGELRRSNCQAIPPQVEGADSENVSNVSRDRRSGSNALPITEVAANSQQEARAWTNLSQTTQDRETELGNKAAQDSKEQEPDRIVPSPCQDPPVQSQHQHSKVLPLVQDEDADFLHAFLTRAKAKKAAKEASPQKVDRVPPSPMTRSRAALVQLSTNSPSPQKTMQHQLDTTNEAQLLETNRVGSPCRRSARTRLPRPQKAPTVTANTIPVRRSNGTEFIFLQSTDTAQLALATRTNTKRNKGEALIPKIKLQTLSQAQQSPCKSPKPRKGKGVSWKDEPVYFGEEADEMEGAGQKRKEDDKPRLRKIRRLGAANGTPAPKKMMAEDALEVRRPVSGKRSKAIKP